MPRTKAAKPKAPAKPKRREFLQLAKTLTPGKIDLSGWYLSEKLDGLRCFWDGGVSRGKPTTSVPFAGITDPKTGLRKAKIKPVATGLWSRNGNPFQAPDWFLDLLPKVPLDGELFAGRGNFQLTTSIVSGDAPDERFDQIEYRIYGMPSINHVFQTGEIKHAQMWATFDYAKLLAWYEEHVDQLFTLSPECTFEDELHELTKRLPEVGPVFLHRQNKLPLGADTAMAEAERLLSEVLDAGGEGVMLRAPSSVWTPRRVPTLLKYKPFEDSEAKIIGFVAGREGKQGNCLGKIGTLAVEWKGVRFELGTGMKAWEREFDTPAATEWATQNPGKPMPEGTQGHYLKVGQVVTFKYRELSDDGIPKEGRYWRQRTNE